MAWETSSYSVLDQETWKNRLAKVVGYIEGDSGSV